MNLLTVVMSMAVSSISFSATADTSVPDFTAAIYSNSVGFGLILSPPAKHHFNIDAPLSAATASKAIFSVAEKTKARIIFETTAGDLKKGDSIETMAFLCDDAKTYCVKKKLTVAYAVTTAKPKSTSPKAENAPAQRTPPKTKKASKKDKHGFWVNAQSEAIAESERTHKPLLIDFYGIWCPPCNQLNEVVFPTKAFHAAAKNFVLLKMDADAETSWELKSQFKIGGYPTLLVMKAPKANDSVKQYEEIDRVVGYFPAAELVQKMNEAYANRNQNFEARILAMRHDYVDGLKKLIESKSEQKDYSGEAKYANEGLKLSADDAYFQLVLLQNAVRDHPIKMSERDAQALIEKIVADREKASVETLMRAQTLIADGAEVLKGKGLKFGVSVIDELIRRVNSETKKIDGHELSIADLYAMKSDLADAYQDEALKVSARKATIAAYEQLIRVQKTESRGLNLELAYWLWNDGRAEDAKKIYDRFIQKYPTEFTFYFASAKMNLELKKFAEAKAQAEKAVEYSYGDNHLRSVERQVRVLIAAGEPKAAAEKGNAVLKQAKSAQGFEVRTDRYLLALKKAISAAEAEANKGTL